MVARNQNRAFRLNDGLQAAACSERRAHAACWKLRWTAYMVGVGV